MLVYLFVSLLHTKAQEKASSARACLWLKFQKTLGFLKFFGRGAKSARPTAGLKKRQVQQELVSGGKCKKMRVFFRFLGAATKSARPTQGLKKGRRPGAQHPPKILISSV